MGNGKDLIFIPRERSSMIQTRMVRKDVSCLTGGCQSRPGVFQLVQVSNYGDEWQKYIREGCNCKRKSGAKKCLEICAIKGGGGLDA